MTKTQVTYPGLFQTIYRAFDTRERAVQWSRQCGVDKICTIQPTNPLDKWVLISSGIYGILERPITANPQQE